MLPGIIPVRILGAGERDAEGLDHGALVRRRHGLGRGLVVRVEGFAEGLDAVARAIIDADQLEPHAHRNVGQYFQCAGPLDSASLGDAPLEHPGENAQAVLGKQRRQPVKHVVDRAIDIVVGLVEVRFGNAGLASSAMTALIAA